MIRLARPDIDDTDLAAVAEVLRTGFLVQGPRVAEFERAIASRARTAHGVAVANCTAALHLALTALDLVPGDRVAVAAYSWPASANAIVLAGAEPVFVDITPDTWGMDPAALAAALEADPGIRAVLPVHVFGAMADVAAIGRIAADRGVAVVEDAACALGAAWEGRPAGSWGRAGCFSFHPRKSITTGEGGMIVTDDSALADRCRALRNHGLDPSAPGPDFILAGHNLRLTEFQGALGLTQLAKLDRMLAHREQLATWYAAALGPSGVGLQQVPTPGGHARQAWVVLLPSSLAPRRGEVIERLRTREVEATLGTHHIPLTSYYRRRHGHRPGEFPVTDDVASRALALPFHSAMGEEEVATVAQALTRTLSELA